MTVNIINPTKGRASLTDHPAPGDNNGIVQRIADGRWVTTRGGYVCLGRTRTEAIAKYQAWVDAR